FLVANSVGRALRCAGCRGFAAMIGWPSMNPPPQSHAASTRESDSPVPRVGVSYRTLNEQVTNQRERLEKYLEAVRRAGGEPVEVALNLPAAELAKLASTLDALFSQAARQMWNR